MGCVWAQLFRKLWLARNRYVTRFLDGIGAKAPQPWLRPSAGYVPGGG